MNEEIQKLPETSRDDNFVKDILYENILGPEKPGRLRTYGVGATPKDVYRMSDNMNAGQKKAFEDAVNEKVEIIRGELREEMNSKLADFKEELIAQFEARMVWDNYLVKYYSFSNFFIALVTIDLCSSRGHPHVTWHHSKEEK